MFVTREKCCDAFPEYVCGDCPFANDSQRSQPPKFWRSDGKIGGIHRCELCFMPESAHNGPHITCPTAAAPKPEQPVPVAAPSAPPSPPVRRVQHCNSCGKPWNGARVARGIEGMYCGTCGQQSYYE